MMHHMLLVLGLALVLVLVSGCTSGGTTRLPTAEYVLVYLTSGPTSGQGTKAERDAMFKGHMANLNRLASEKRLVIAGPFAAPRDKAWRGIMVLDVASIAEAQALSATDPGVQAGEFIVQAHRMHASPELRRTLELEGELQAARKANPTEPPPQIRKYVMITTAHPERCAAALDKTNPPLRAVWCGWCADSRRGVAVVDADSAEAVAAALHSIDPLAGEVDTWYSTTSLAKLSPDAAVWRN